MDIEIRSEKESDFSQVYELNKIAFAQENEANLVSALRHSNAFIPELSLVAVVVDKVIGHILFTKIKIKNEDGKQFDSLALAPMSVLPEYQNKGVGGQLINEGLFKAKELGYQSVIVLGHKNYYPKFGFLPTDKWNIKAPFDVPSDVFMGIELVTDGLKDVTGTVIYAKEFALV